MIAQNELISVVVPVYNVEKYLRRCVDSIRKQTYKNIEVILVDDGSTDSSGALCDQLAKEDTRIRTVHQENRGLSEARNTGIANMHGNYVAFIDSDDFISNFFLERLYTACVENRAEIAICDYLKGEYNTIDSTVGTGSTNISCLDAKDMLSSWHSNYTDIETVAWNKLYKASIFLDKGIRYPAGVLHEDVMTTHLCVNACEKVAIVNEKLYLYYVRENTISSSISEKRVRDIVYVNEKRYYWFGENGYQESCGRLEKFALKVYMEIYCKAYFADVSSNSLDFLFEKFSSLLREVKVQEIHLTKKESFLFWFFENAKFFVINVLFRIYRINCVRELVRRRV